MLPLKLIDNYTLIEQSAHFGLVKNWHLLPMAVHDDVYYYAVEVHNVYDVTVNLNFE